MQWRTDEYAETQMTEMNIAWKVKMLACGEIDFDKSIKNNARLKNPLDDYWVQRYAKAMRNGAVFPRLVVARCRRTNGTYYYLIISGNHRGTAARRIGETHVEAYVIEGDDVTITDLLPRLLNAGGSHEEEKEDVMENAMHILERYGSNAAEVADLLHLSKTKVADEQRYRRLKKYLETKGVGFDPSNGRDRGIILKLGTIQNEKVMLEAARYASEKRLPVCAVEAMVSAILSNRGSEREMLDALDAQKTLLNNRPKIISAANERGLTSKFDGALSRLENMLTDRTKLTHFQITNNEQLIETAKRCRKISAALAQLADSCPVF